MTSRIRANLLLPSSPTTTAALPPPEPPSHKRCCKAFCGTPATRRLLVVALPNEGTFSFENFYVCEAHIPANFSDVFPEDGQFRTMYPTATGFQLLTQPA